MRLYEITRRGFIKGLAGAAVGAAAAMANVPAAHASAGVKSKYNPYDPKVQAEVLKIVAKLRKIDKPLTKPMPKVVSYDQIDPKIFLETWGFDPGGPVNHYHYKRNMIILMSKDVGVEKLAHEYSHYLDMVYLGVNPNDPMSSSQDEFVAKEVEGKVKQLVSKTSA